MTSIQLKSSMYFNICDLDAGLTMRGQMEQALHLWASRHCLSTIPAIKGLTYPQIFSMIRISSLHSSNFRSFQTLTCGMTLVRLSYIQNLSPFFHVFVPWILMIFSIKSNIKGILSSNSKCVTNHF